MNSYPDTDKNSVRSAAGLKFELLPSWRLQTDLPWMLWAVGWLSIFKGTLWLSSDPVVPALLAEVLATKFILTTIPFVVFGIGIWNLRRWAAFGLIALASVDLVFYLIFPASTGVMTGGSFWALAVVLLIFNGPAGNVLILLATPALFKHTGPKATTRRRIANRTSGNATNPAAQQADRESS